jgi:superfamily II DNA or RNA helicase
MLFTLADITAHILQEHFNKGWRLFIDGRISAPIIQRGGELITAVIPRPRSRPVRIYVRTSKAADAITIDGECSCAKKRNCEHVAAVLLQALHDKQALPTPPKKPRKKPPPAASPQQALLYVLQPDKNGLLIETFAARRLKKDVYSESTYFEPGRAAHRTPARFLEPDDLELLDTLNQLPRTPDTEIPMLSGPQSAHILEAILASGRCFLQDIQWGSRLEQGTARALELHWEVDDFGNQCCDWTLTPEADQLILPSSPWYLDSERGRCGIVESSLPPALITELLNLPPVEAEQVNTLQSDLQQRYPAVDIPPLQHFEFVTAPRIKPTPCLCLGSVEQHDWGDWIECEDFARLSFDYDGILLAHQGTSTHFDGERITRVPRNKKTEQAAVKQLHKLGFEADEDGGRQADDDCFFLDSDSFDPGSTDNDFQRWLHFQEQKIPKLRAQGWRIEYDNFRFQLVEASHWYCDVDQLEQQDWFSIGLGVEIEGRRVDLLPILVEYLRNFPRGLPDAEKLTTERFIIPLVDEPLDQQCDEQLGERLLLLPAKRVLPLLETLLEMLDGTARNEGQRLHLNRSQLARLTALDHDEDSPRLHWLGDNDAQQLARCLRKLDGIPTVSPPNGLMATLRPYQQRGLDWLQFLREYRLAGILADDMGLGKTVQALAHVLLEKQQGRADRPSLVIAPTSLMFNWRREAEQFTPQLKVLVLHGPQRHAQFAEIAKHDLILTTYPLLSRDKERLLAHAFHLLILDEAQVIKNPKAQASHVVREIDARHRLCLTGTPLENHLGELWSLFDFLLPGLLGNGKQFRRFFRSPIEKHGSKATAERLSHRIRPFLLRRSKQQVATELPPKTNIIQTVVLEGKQQELYETVRLAMHRRVREEIERRGMNRSHIVVLDALLKLRQVCCDPRLVKLESAQKVKQSAKLTLLMELLPEMVAAGRRILLFSQFTSMLGLIEDELKNADIAYLKLTGQTRNRAKPVQQFQDGEVPLFLISLKAGGVGLNLTRADTVIHYDPWWNPAVERQATDRAHRIGQQQAVFVYKLICEGTLEEKIHAMQQRKQALADDLYQAGGNNESQWSEQDLDALFGPLDEKINGQ